MDLQARVARLVVEPVRQVRDCIFQVAHNTYPKSKSSTPNLLYLISTLRYIMGTSACLLPMPISGVGLVASSDLSSAFLASLLADSRAFSLKNLGALRPELADLLTLRVSSTWFLRMPRELRP